MNTIGTPLLWGVFAIIISIMLIFDLFFQKYEKNSHNVNLKQAVIWCFGWMMLSVSFCVIFWLYLVSTEGYEMANLHVISFLNGFLIEKALAFDNVFVWLTLFNYFNVPTLYQRRVLVYGILSAIFLRSIMIFSGSYLINQFEWLFYIFGIFLFFTSLKMIFQKEENIFSSDNYLFRWLYTHLHITTVNSEHFFIRKNGLLYATQLLLVLILIELSDIIFAVDSIPAIFAVTTDPFIIWTSNLLAMFGLRSIYFLLSNTNIIKRFSMLKYGLSAILIFTSVKMMVINFYRISVTVTLGAVLSILIITLIISILTNRQNVENK